MLNYVYNIITINSMHATPSHIVKCNESSFTYAITTTSHKHHIQYVLHTHINSSAHTNIHTYTVTYKHTHTDTHKYTHIHTHTNTWTNTWTHTTMHTPNN